MQSRRSLARRLRRGLVMRIVAVASLCVVCVSPGSAAAGVLGPGEINVGTVVATATNTGADITWTPQSSDLVHYYLLAVADTRTGSAFTAQTHGNYGTVHLSDLVNGDRYTVLVTAMPIAQIVGEATVTPVAPSTTAAPSATVVGVTPTSVTGGGAGLRVTVAAPPARSGVDYFAAAAADPAGTTVARALAAAGAGSTNITLGPLAPNTPYHLVVVAHTPDGVGPLTWLVHSTGSSQCPAGACLTLAATKTQFIPKVNGLLNDVGSGPVAASAITEMHPSIVRVNVGYGSAPGIAQTVSGMGADLIENLADAWYDKTDSGKAGGAMPPWECWTCYSQFVTAQVTQILQAGVHPAFWEIANEPGGPGTYPSHLLGDASLYLKQLEVAATAIHDVDPTARVLTPTIGSFALGSAKLLDAPNLSIDLVLAHAGDIPGFAGLDWHEISPTESPSAAADDVTMAKQVAALAGYPDITTVISEYTTPYDAPLAGAEATWIGALAHSGVSHAGRSCWENQPGEGSSTSTCIGMADGLLTAAGDVTGPGQVAAQYGNLGVNNATVTAVTSSSPFVAASASTDNQGVTHILIGHEASCLPHVNAACPSQSVASNGSMTVSMTVPVAADLVLESAKTTGGRPGPAQLAAAAPRLLTAAGGNVTFAVHIPDGAAVTVTLLPMAQSAPPPKPAHHHHHHHHAKHNRRHQR